MPGLVHSSMLNRDEEENHMCKPLNVAFSPVALGACSVRESLPPAPAPSASLARRGLGGDSQRSGAEGSAEEGPPQDAFLGEGPKRVAAGGQRRRALGPCEAASIRVCRK